MPFRFTPEVILLLVIVAAGLAINFVLPLLPVQPAGEFSAPVEDVSQSPSFSLADQQEANGYIIQLRDPPVFSADEPEEDAAIAGSFTAVTRQAAAKTKKQQLDTKRKTALKKALSKVKQTKPKPGTITGRIVGDENAEPEVLGEYAYAFNGFALNISAEEAEALRTLPEVKAVYPNLKVEATLMDSVPLISADKVWQLDKEGNNCAESGKECLTGKGVTIGIIDTGVDYTHPDLGGCFGTTKQDIEKPGEGGGDDRKIGSSSTVPCSSYTSLFAEQTSDVTLLTERINAAYSGTLCPGDNAKLAANLNVLVNRRKSLLLSLMKENPAAALETSELSPAAVAALGKDNSAQLVEKRGAFTGEMDVLHADDFEHNISKFLYSLRTPEKRFDVFLTEDLPVLSMTTIEGKGMSLDSVLAARTGDVKILSPPPLSPAAENIGPQKTLVVVAGNGNNPPFMTVEEANTLIFGDSENTVQDFYKKNSYNKVSLVGKTFGSYQFNSNGCNVRAILEDAIRAVSLENDNGLETVERIIMFVSRNDKTGSCEFSGQGTIGKINVYLPNGKTIRASASLNYAGDLDLSSHELGHNFGAMHASALFCRNNAGKLAASLTYDCDMSEYGDEHSVMGSFPAHHHTAAHKLELGWMDIDNVVTTTGGTYLLRPVEIDRPAGDILMIRIPVHTETSFYKTYLHTKDNIYYTLDFRQPSDAYDSTESDPEMYKGVLLRFAELKDDGEFSFKQTNRIGRLVIKKGETYTDTINGISITVNDVTAVGAQVSIEQIPSTALPADFRDPIIHFDFDGVSDIYSLRDKAGFIAPAYGEGVTPELGGLRFGSTSSVKFSPFASVVTGKTNEVTVSFWINIKELPLSSGRKTIYYAGHQVVYATNEGLLWKLNTNQGYITLLAPVQFSTNKWYHVALTYGGGVSTIYVNGHIAAQKTTPDNPSLSVSYISKRSFLGFRSASFNGILDEFMLFSRALTGSEVVELKNGHIPEPDDTPDAENCKVAGGYDFVNKDDDPMDDQGHGTHVAATAAGNGTLKGVAPDATVYAYKVLDSSGSGSFASVMNGIERSVDPNQDGDMADRLDIISLSLGAMCLGYDTSCGPDDPVSAAIDKVVDAGVVAVIAAGNSGPGEGTIKSPGTARKAITVGASDKSNKLSSFSSRGPIVWTKKDGSKNYLIKPDVVAPGVNICAALSSQHQSFFDSYKCLDDNHMAISGTSMATPHISGAVALIKQKNPDWNPEEVKSALKSAAVDVGANVNIQGYGRIDVRESANVVKPLFVELQTNGFVRGKIDIIGTAKGENFFNYTVFYGTDNNPALWTEIRSSNEQIEDGIIVYNFDSSLLDEGKNYLILVAYDTFGRKYSAQTMLIKDDFTIIEPRSRDIYRLGDKIIVNATIFGFDSFTVEYGSGENPLVWLTNGISLTGGGAGDIIEGVVAEINTQRLEAGYYTLRVSAIKNRKVSSDIVGPIYLDATLKKGWPVRVPFFVESQNRLRLGVADTYTVVSPLSVTETNKSATTYTREELIKTIASSTQYQYNIWAGFLVPIVADLDKDGMKEIVVSVRGEPSELRVYRSNGSLWWKTSVNNLNTPLILDVDNDGFMEIVAPAFSMAYAFDHTGNPLWKTSIPPDNMYTLLAADLDLNGNKEIVIKGNDAWNTFITILDKNGIIQNSWEIPRPRWGGNLVGSPAVGNFDDDPDLEIVIAGPSEFAGPTRKDGVLVWNNTGIVYVFNRDGSLVNGWPIYTEGIILSSPVVGDLNNDGKQDIVLGLMYETGRGLDERYGGLYIFDRNGNVLPGWPILKGRKIWSTPALADLNSDGYLEISVSPLGKETFVIDNMGRTLNGWPQIKTWSDYYSIIVADVDSDKRLDVLTTAGDGFYPSIEQHGGVYAWNNAGVLLDGFPKVTEVSAQAPAVISDVDNDGKLDLVASSDWDYDIQMKMYKLRGTLYVWEIGTPFTKKSLPWPTFMHDTQRTGCADCEKPACTDSDGGNNRYVNGKTVFNGEEFSDFCVYRDEGLWNEVTEYFCQGNVVKSEIHLCEYGCAGDGAGGFAGNCNGDGSLLSCTDSDRGSSYFTTGTVSAGTFNRQDFCAADQNDVVEWTCKDDVFVAETKPAGCVAGCLDGACTSYCTDSDGNNMFTRGTVIVNDEMSRDVCSASKTHVLEVLCSIDNRNVNQELECPTPDCTNGACLNRVYDSTFEKNLSTQITERVKAAPQGKWGLTTGAVISKPKGETDNVLVTGVNAKNRKSVPSTGAAAVQIVPVEPGGTYTITVSAKVVAGTPVAELQPLDANNRPTSLSSTRTLSGFPKGKWGTKSTTITVPPNAAFLKISLFTARNVDGTAYWDDVVVK